VLCYSANRDFRSLVQANEAAAVPVVCPLRHQISGVLGGPAVRTLCSCWNHGNCGPTLYVAECTRRRVSTKICVDVALGEDVIATAESVCCPDDCSGMSLMTINVSFPLGIFRHAQVVTAATWLTMVRPGCISLNTAALTRKPS